MHDAIREEYQVFHRIVVVALLALILSGCASFPPLAVSNPGPGGITTVIPLAKGAAWTYDAKIDYVDQAQDKHWTGKIIESITDSSKQGDAQVFTSELSGHPIRTDPSETKTLYVALANRLYHVSDGADIAALVANKGKDNGSDELLEWPLDVNQRFGDPDMLANNDPMYVWVVEATEDVSVPAGKYAGCYRLSLRTTPDRIVSWFCPGVGIAKWEYHHNGSLQDEVWELASFRKS
jgi:hypothetical protein